MMKSLPGPKWRNWQTRMIQGHVPARVWGFESPLRHHLHSRIFVLHPLMGMRHQLERHGVATVSR
jgi:hypothetical protein